MPKGASLWRDDDDATLTLHRQHAASFRRAPASRLDRGRLSLRVGDRVEYVKWADALHACGEAGVREEAAALRQQVARLAEIADRVVHGAELHEARDRDYYWEAHGPAVDPFRHAESPRRSPAARADGKCGAAPPPSRPSS
eukprot:gene25282-53505_t